MGLVATTAAGFTPEDTGISSSVAAGCVHTPPHCYTSALNFLAGQERPWIPQVHSFSADGDLAGGSVGELVAIRSDDADLREWRSAP